MATRDELIKRGDWVTPAAWAYQRGSVGRVCGGPDRGHRVMVEWHYLTKPQFHGMRRWHCRNLLVVAAPTDEDIALWRLAGGSTCIP